MKSIIKKLNKREEILMVLLLTLLITSLLFFINYYLANLKEDSISSFQSSKVYYQKMELALADENQSQNTSQVNPSNLGSTISSLAREKNLSIDRIQPINETSYIVTINNGNFASIYAWIKDLDEQKSIIVSKASIRRSTSNPRNKIRAQIVLEII